MAKKSKSFLKKKKTFTNFQILLFIIAFAALGMIAVLQSFAAPGGGGGKHTTSSTITGPVLVEDINGDGLVNHGDSITFNISTTATDQPFVNLQCFQNGTRVLNGWAGFFDAALNKGRSFGLNSGAWQSGAANCTAFLDMDTKQGFKQLASTNFNVNP
ncbi:MAG TPA: hypothetical protein VLF79_03160 [Candidatus Saccharimonadales bacterium]|nr:hypothetical protein [Candidatus Saccharimonadales bacterium]